MSTPNASPQRYLRFSLRTLLIAVLILGGGFGWLGNEIIQIRQRQHLLARIKAAGGEVAYQHAGEKSLSKLPPRSHHWLRRFFGDEVFAEIQHVLWMQSVPDDADLSLLSELQHLKTLMLSGPNIDDTTAAELARIDELRHLSLSDTRITSKGLAGLGQLQTLTLGGVSVSDATLEQIESLTGLEALTLFGTSVTSKGLAPVGRLRNLQWLKLLRNPQIDAAALESVGSLTRLRELDIVDSPLDDSGLVHLRNLRQLRRLVLWLCKVTDAGMPDIATLTQLEHLNLIGADVTDSGLAELQTVSGLAHLELCGTQIGDAGVAHLKSLPKLKSLDLSQTLVTDAACLHLAALKHLRWLELDSTAITDDGLPSLRTLVDLESLTVGPNVTVEGATKLKEHLPKCQITGRRSSSPDFSVLPDGTVHDPPAKPP